MNSGGDGAVTLSTQLEIKQANQPTKKKIYQSRLCTYIAVRQVVAGVCHTYLRITTTTSIPYKVPTQAKYQVRMYVYLAVRWEQTGSVPGAGWLVGWLVVVVVVIIAVDVPFRSMRACMRCNAYGI